MQLRLNLLLVLHLSCIVAVDLISMQERNIVHMAMVFLWFMTGLAYCNLFSFMTGRTGLLYKPLLFAISAFVFSLDLKIFCIQHGILLGKI